MSDRPFAPAPERNKLAILDVLRDEFADCASILEIGSGTGQHAVYFATELDHLVWQTSDLAENHAGILAWLREAGAANVREPLRLDVTRDSVPVGSYDGVFSANTAHIMSVGAVQHMFSLASAALADRGVFVLYGPFRQGGGFNTQSNAEFHRSLRSRDPDMGIRHLEDLDRLAEAGGMGRTRLYAMPANNHVVVWHKHSARYDA